MDALIGRSAAPIRRRATAAALATVIVACGSALRTVPVGPHPATAASPIIVDSPPPATKVETIPPDPGAPCAWLDGRWEWVDRSWEWAPGSWVVPPQGCHFATPDAVWVPAVGRGLLFYLAGRWYPDTGSTACAAARPCGATPTDTHAVP